MYMCQVDELHPKLFLLIHIIFYVKYKFHVGTLVLATYLIIINNILNVHQIDIKENVFTVKR